MSSSQFVNVQRATSRWEESLRLNPIIFDPIANTAVMRLYVYCLGSHWIVSNGATMMVWNLADSNNNKLSVWGLARSSNNFGDYFVIHFHSTYIFFPGPNELKNVEDLRKERSDLGQRIRALSEDRELLKASFKVTSCVPEHFQAIPQIDFLCDKQ